MSLVTVQHSYNTTCGSYLQHWICISDNQTSKVTKFSFWLLQNSAHVSDYKSNGRINGELTDLSIHPEELKKTTKTSP
jgi:hypothetical protein